MAKNTEIVAILKIPSRTFSNWKNAEDYKCTLYYALKSMTIEELEEFKAKGLKE